MIALPLAHMGHVVAFVPFFAPPLLLTLGLLVLTVRDRLRRHAETCGDEGFSGPDAP